MSPAYLFDKLQEREIELGRLEKYESQEKKSKGITLKVDSMEELEEYDPDEYETSCFL